LFGWFGKSGYQGIESCNVQGGGSHTPSRGRMYGKTNMKSRVYNEKFREVSRIIYINILDSSKKKYKY
jgi:hypothetical protein